MDRKVANASGTDRYCFDKIPLKMPPILLSVYSVILYSTVHLLFTQQKVPITVVSRVSDYLD